jgi:hypothetical protein
VGFGWIFRAAIALSIFSACFALSLLHGSSQFQQVKQAVTPYLIPEEHPIKLVLDQIFSASDVCFTFDTLKAAGFTCRKLQKHTRLIIAKHPSLPEYLFKLYLHIQPYHSNKPEYYFWVSRILGAEKIRQRIEQRNLNALFKVPKKWIYFLPRMSLGAEDYYPKYTLLVEEDMQLLSEDENLLLWESGAVSKQLLDELLTIVTEIGLDDCLKPDNIPFSLDGRVSFIDTQSFGKRKIDYKNLLPYLSEENKAYWKSVTIHHGEHSLKR